MRRFLPTFRPTYSRPRFGPDPAPVSGSPGSNGAPPPPGLPKIDLTDPLVQEAIMAQVRIRTETHEAEKQRILQNQEQILTEKRAWDDLKRTVGDPATVAQRLREAEELRTKSKAPEGTDPEAFKRAVEDAAQAKFKTYQEEQAEISKKSGERLQALETELESAKKQSHRNWMLYEVTRASMPPEHRLVQDGAEDVLVARLEQVMVRHEPSPGLPPVARFKVGSSFAAGTGPDGYMDTRELLALARQGKGPVPNLGFCFVSSGEGSATAAQAKVAESDSQPGAGKNWWKMNGDERTAFISKNGAESAKELMDSSGPRPAGTTP